MKKLLVALALLAPLTVEASHFDFEYSYTNPYFANAQQYITSTSNAVLYSEGPVRLWKPNVGGSTFATTTPGIINYHFGFGQPTSEIELWMNMPTFHWSYSQGHNFLYGSTDGVNYTQLAEVQPPPFGSARDLGAVAIPVSLLGASDLYLRVELYSYGRSAFFGGALTNTAQLSRHDVNLNNTSFRLNANFQQNPGPGSGSVPEPGTLALSLVGLVALPLARRRRRRTEH